MSDRIVREAIMHLAGTHNKDELYLVQAEVDSVDIPSRTCNVTTISGRAVYSIENVSIMATVDDGVLIVPTVGSVVFVIHNKRDVRFIAQFSEVDKVLYVINDTTIEMTDGKTQFNDGSFDGLVKVKDLVDRLNAIEKDINKLKYLFSTWIPIPNDGGSALKSLTGGWFGQQLQETQQSDLENTKITHGE